MPAVPMKVPEFCPGATVSVEGTVRCLLLDWRGRVSAEARASVNVAVQEVVVEAGAIIAAGTQTNDDTSTLTRRVYVS